MNELKEYVLLVNRLMKAPAFSDEANNLILLVRDFRNGLSSENSAKADKVDKILGNYHS